MSGECGLIYSAFPVVSTCADIYNECKFVTTIEGKLTYVLSNLICINFKSKNIFPTLVY